MPSHAGVRIEGLLRRFNFIYLNRSRSRSYGRRGRIRAISLERDVMTTLEQICDVREHLSGSGHVRLFGGGGESKYVNLGKGFDKSSPRTAINYPTHSGVPG